MNKSNAVALVPVEEHMANYRAARALVGKGEKAKLKGVLPKSALTGKKKVPKLGEMC